MSSPLDEPPVLVRAVGTTMVITLNRPAKRNAVDPSLTAHLDAAVRELETRGDVRCAILTGAGLAFSAGADLNYLARGESHLLETVAGGLGGLVRYPRTKPMIAAVNGPALAGGCELALSCDVVVAANSASFGLPEVTRGIAASAGGMFRWARALPFGKAMLPLLTGEPVSADEAASYGLIWSSVPDDVLMTTAFDLAQRIGRAAPMAVAATLRFARLASGLVGSAEDWQLSDAVRDRLGATADAVEGSAAFLQRRQPDWTNS